MDFATAVATGSAPSAPASPSVSTAANAAPQAPASPMDKISQLFPPAQAAAPDPAAPQAPSQASPAAPVQAQPQVQPDQAAQYQQQLVQENARLREQAAQGQQAAMQQALEKTTAALEKITAIQSNPVLTPEQRKAQIDAEFAEINLDAKSTVKKWVGEDMASLKKTVEELTQKLNTLEPAVQKVDRFSTRDENLARLFSQGHKEVGDSAFREGMLHPDNVAEVQKMFYGQETDAARIYKDPGFYNALLQNAKIRAAQGFQATQAQSQADMAAQANIAQAGGGFAPNGRPAGANAGTPALTPEQQFKQGLMGTRKSFGDVIAAAQFGNR